MAGGDGEFSFAEHVTSTNLRLTSIRNNLFDATTFPNSCIELTKWCSDQRAFTSHFEENLMLALQVAMENGTKENYDFNLTHALVSACFTHRKHLSKPSATRIGRWYEQMRRLKKNGGKRKRAPPKPKDQPLPPAAQPLSGAPPLPNGAVDSQQLQSLPLLTSPNGVSSENNNFMFSPASQDGSMYGPGVPMGAPGHMQPGPPFPGQHPGMQSYPGQMTLPYGQMEGNHAMYDQRAMAARAAGRPAMMPEYPPQMAMGQQHPGAQMMRMPVQYPGGHPQMAGHHPQMQYGQMMRAPPVSVYGQMNHPQPYPVTAHPNPHPFIHPEMRAIYENTIASKVERVLVEESDLVHGQNGVEVELTSEVFEYLKNDNCDLILSVWQVVKENNVPVQIQVWVNQQHILACAHGLGDASIKKLMRPGKNLVQFGYQIPDHVPSFHRTSIEFVTKKHMNELRKMCFLKSGTDIPALANHGRSMYVHMAQKKPNGIERIPLNCSLSKKRMITPVRHTNCSSLFDIAVMVSQNASHVRYFCPTCHSHFKFDDIHVDHFLAHVIQSMPATINEIIVDKNGAIRAAEPEKEEPKPKRGKKRSTENEHTIKRIKSETFVKQEPGMFPDMHGRVPFSPMTMPPGSVPPDWSRLQSPQIMQSPNNVQLGPSTPATPGMVLNPASSGSLLNMSSPRQMMPMAHAVHTGVHEHTVPQSSGSAPYTPESVKNDKGLDALFLIPALFEAKLQIINEDKLVMHYLHGTTKNQFDDVDVVAFEDHSQEPSQTLLAPGSSSSSSSNFTPPFDDIHLGNRASH